MKLTKAQEQMLWEKWCSIHPSFRCDTIKEHPKKEKETAKQYAVRYFTTIGNGIWWSK
jgi:hypothetical protein